MSVEKSCAFDPTQNAIPAETLGIQPPRHADERQYGQVIIASAGSVAEVTLGGGSGRADGDENSRS